MEADFNVAPTLAALATAVSCLFGLYGGLWLSDELRSPDKRTFGFGGVFVSGAVAVLVVLWLSGN